MAEPRWQQMLRICLQRETAPPSRFMQLATLTPHGRPAVRTVVFRGWLPDAPPTITACTDLRSDKIPALRSFPYAEICWYFIEARQQYRLTGEVKVVDSTESSDSLSTARVAIWKQLSPSARRMFFEQAPGTPRSTSDVTLHTQTKHDTDLPAETFALLLLQPTRVDVVDLRTNNRLLFQQVDHDGSWQETDVFP